MKNLPNLIQVENYKKKWGKEVWLVNNSLYCCKLLVFDIVDAKCSMHFHKNKVETWFVLYGEFEVKYVDTRDASIHTIRLKEGRALHIPKFTPHQIISKSIGATLIETSTFHEESDSYRIFPGDSQQQKSNL
jgi:mannose-6-phosphate isomerase-like protein (cupin superfamily)